MSAPRGSALDRWCPHRAASSQARVRLLCFAHAGGGTSAFREWRRELPQTIDVCAVELPGRETRFREPFATDVPSIVDELGGVLEPLLDRPVAIFGHSLGAILAVETARRLVARGKPPCWLFASGARGPSVPRRNPPTHALPDPEFIEKLRGMSGTPPEVFSEPELLELLLPLLRADFRLAEVHRYDAADPLPCAITASGGVEDDGVTAEDLAAWERETTAGFSRHMFPGGHFYLQTSRRALLRLVAEKLGQLR